MDQELLLLLDLLEERGQNAEFALPATKEHEGGVGNVFLGATTDNVIEELFY